MQPVPTRPATDGSVDSFVGNLKRLRAEPFLARSDEEAAQVLRRILQGSQSIVQAKLPARIDRFVQIALEGRNYVRVQELGAGDVVETLSRADAGITWAQYGIASQGTLVESVQDDAQKLVSSMPRVHVALIRSCNILPDFTSIMKDLSRTILTSPPEQRPVVSLITGPSRTSDIESRLLYGVHGPLTLKVLILDWTPEVELHD